MNFIKIFLLSSLLVTFTSCSSLSGAKKSCCTKKADHSCCKESKECKDGNCKLDKSCCDDKCGNCTGQKGDCGESCDSKDKPKTA